MRSTAWALLVAGASALPELSISKRDAHLRQSPVARGLVKRDGTVATTVYDVLTWSTGGAYYANITVGTPPQEQVVILDTGSSDLYFDASTASQCQTTGPYSCRGGTFNPRDSSSYSVAEPAPAFNTSFGDGSTASGPFGQDVIGISDVRIDDVQFGVAEEVNSTTGYAVGLMGVGYSAIEASRHQYPNMPEVLKAAGVINSRLYSVYLNDADQTGTILFGGIDASKYKGELATIDLLEDSLTGIVDQFITTVTDLSATVDGHETSLFSGGSNSEDAYYHNDPALAVLLDTGSAAWNVPPSYYRELIAPTFPYVDSDGFCPCSHRDSGDSLTLTFAGKVQITVPARDFIIPLYNSTTNEPVPYNVRGDPACVLTISPQDDSDTGYLTLGDAILRSMYVVFDLDNGQVSIAQANVNSTADPQIVTVPDGASGIASAISSSYSAAPTNFNSIADDLHATESFSVSTAQSTVGDATGTAAIPTDAQVSPTSTSSESGGSGGSGGSSGSSGSGQSTSSAAAAGLVVPGADWSGVWVTGMAVFMAALGASLMM